MKRNGQNLSYRQKRRGLDLDATAAGPYVKLGVAALIVILAALAVIFLLVPALSGRLDFAGLLAGEKTAPPVPTAEMPALLTEPATEFTLDTKRGEAVLLDPAVSGGTLTYASGASETDCDRLVTYDLATKKRKSYTPARENDCLRMPRLCGKRLVYFDAKAGGGGSVRLFDPGTGEAQTLLTLSAGMPRLFCDGTYLLLRAQTSEGATKLYAFDLTTFEAVALCVYEDPAYALSDPGVSGGSACYAVPSETAPGTARIDTVSLTDGTHASLETGMAAHDVSLRAGALLWLSGNHDDSADLYLSRDGGTPFCIAAGVIDAALCEGCAVYGRDGTVYAYSFYNDKTYMISGAEAYAQLCAAGDDYALWRVLEDGGPRWYALKVN